MRQVRRHLHVESKPPKVEGRCDECGGELTVRSDDKPETVRDRLKVYHSETEPLMDFYAKRGNLRKVHGEQDMASTARAIEEALI